MNDFNNISFLADYLFSASGKKVIFIYVIK